MGTGFSFMQDITCSKPYTHPSEPVAFFSLGSVQLGLISFSPSRTPRGERR